MSKIVRLPANVELWLTYSWSNNNHGVCGHLYEVIDYFWILHFHFRVGILLCEDITWDVVELAIRSKYDFTDTEITTIRNSMIFHNRPRLLVGRNILFTDGGVINTANVMMYFDNVIYFACGNKSIKNNQRMNTWVLQDDRVYDPVMVNGVDYKKRILFDRLRRIEQYDDKVLVYATKNCRSFSLYDELKAYEKPILAIVNEIPTEPHDGIEFVVPPIIDLFSRFSTYVYTPVPRKFDCSPRFIAECKHYGRDVIYHNIDYLEHDTGLYWRMWDIQHDFSSLCLCDNDNIIRIIRSIV